VSNPRGPLHNARYYFRRARELPPDTALKKAIMKPLKVASAKLEGAAARLLPMHVSDAALLQSLEGVSSIGDTLDTIRGNRSAFFIQHSERGQVISIIRQRSPHLETEIAEEAEKICNHVFDLLGSGPVNLDEFAERHGGKEVCGYLPWHFDFKTSYRWNPKQFYKEVRPAYGKADIKVPWELSRFQHVAVLGQAYWMTGDEKYAQEFVRQVSDWIDRNPPKFGVNWVCTMDVAIRVANWILGFYFFKNSQALTDEFLIKFLKSLLIHGRYIMSNLENKGITTNHYLADLVGLIYLGIAFPEFKEARRWRKFGAQELVKEMGKQVYDDGMDFEASTCYHRLALELFFYPTVLCELNGIKLPQAFMDKLRKMFDFVLYVLKPNGRIPQIGDNDNGHLHVLGKRDILDMTYLLTFAAVYYKDSEYKIEEFGFAPEALWLFGPEAYECWNKLPGRSVESLESRAFPQGGIYVMRHKKDYMVISCGPNGQGGLGGHAHNDKLSFELCVDGEDVIVDPGTYVYTTGPKWRNKFRSTLYHNTVTIFRTEQNQLGDLNLTLFRLGSMNTTSVGTWLTGATKDIFEGRLSGFVTNTNGKRVPIVHERSVTYYKCQSLWLIKDALRDSKTSSPEFQAAFHIAPSVQVDCQDNIVILKAGQHRIEIQGDQDTLFEAFDSWYSNKYGVRKRTKVILSKHSSAATFRIIARKARL